MKNYQHVANTLLHRAGGTSVALLTLAEPVFRPGTLNWKLTGDSRDKLQKSES